MGGDGPPFPSRRDGRALRPASQGAATGRRLLDPNPCKEDEPRPSTSSCATTERRARAWFEQKRYPPAPQIVLNTFSLAALSLSIQQQNLVCSLSFDSW